MRDYYCGLWKLNLDKKHLEEATENLKAAFKELEETPREKKK